MQNRLGGKGRGYTLQLQTYARLGTHKIHLCHKLLHLHQVAQQRT